MLTACPIQEEWSKKIKGCSDVSLLEEMRVTLLGKSGLVTQQLKALGQLPPDERRTQGAAINALRDALSALLGGQKEILERHALEQRLRNETLDVTLPVRPEKQGTLHLLTQVTQDIKNYFRDLGFDFVDGPELDDDYHNFDALNIPAHHPARQSHDTFYIKNHPTRLLRTHTTNVEIRTLVNKKPPARLITIGRVYRSDALDATHTPMFHQLEGFVIEPTIHMGHLKGCLSDFCRHFFGVETLTTRFRPSFFPFTEPSAELDIDASFLNKGSNKATKWLEVLGCGMLHPQVLRNCGVDPDTHQGFAFGAGIERLTMLKYGIKDIRELYDSDERWLSHYGTSF